MVIDWGERLKSGKGGGALVIVLKGRRVGECMHFLNQIQGGLTCCSPASDFRMVNLQHLQGQYLQCVNKDCILKMCMSII